MRPLGATTPDPTGSAGAGQRIEWRMFGPDATAEAAAYVNEQLRAGKLVALGHPKQQPDQLLAKVVDPSTLGTTFQTERSHQAFAVEDVLADMKAMGQGSLALRSTQGSDLIDVHQRLSGVQRRQPAPQTSGSDVYDPEG